MKKTIIRWESNILPEQMDVKISYAFGYDFVPVFIAGRYNSSSPVSISITKRIRRKKIGCKVIDENDNVMQVPADGQWHWQSKMAEIVAWGPLPTEDDPRWVHCTDQLPENLIDDLEHETGHGFQGISVLALCETWGQLEVCFANRFRRKETGDVNFDHRATEGWVWSKNVDTVKAWMP